MSGSGALLGLLLAAGALLAVAGLAAARPPRLADRVVRVSTRSPAASLGPLGSLVEIARPLVVRASRVMGRESDSSASLENRLRRAGRPSDVARYRLEQALWLLGGLVVGVALVVLSTARGQAPGGLLVTLILLLTATGGLLAHGRRLAAQTRRRGRRMSEQLPTAAELLAFAVSAGESPIAALDRVASKLSGDLAEDLSEIVHEVRGGMPLVAALRRFGDQSPSADVTRFVDGIAIASERGTPMSEVLRAQAADARSAARRELLESAGRKEILMLIPVVFFILPIVVVIVTDDTRHEPFANYVSLS